MLINKRWIFYGIIGLLVCSFVALGEEGKIREIPKDLSSQMTISELVEYVIEHEVQERGCRLSDKEKREGTAFFFEKNNIQAASFAQTARVMEQLLNALRFSLHSTESPSNVFQKFQLKEYGISDKQWQSYLKKYKTKEDLEKFEQTIPRNMKSIVKSAENSFARIAEKWLLSRKILAELKIQEETKFDHFEFVRKKEKDWWDKVLKKYNFDEKTHAQVLARLSVLRTFGQKDIDMWVTYFKDKGKLE